jgi:hypothetical protein
MDPNATRAAFDAGTIHEGEAVTYAQVYNKQYLAFKQNEAQDQSGTPLSELTFLTEGQRRELRALNINTAEQLASLDGKPLLLLGPGGREKKNQALAYLEAASDQSIVTRQAAEIESLKAQMSDMLSLIQNNATKQTATKFQKNMEKLAAERNAEEAEAEANATDGGFDEPDLVPEETDEADIRQDSDVIDLHNGDTPPPVEDDEFTYINDLSDAELKGYIKQETGRAPSGNINHETLVQRAIELSKAAAYRGE